MVSKHPRRGVFFVGVMFLWGVLSGACASPPAVPEGAGSIHEALNGPLHLEKRGLARIIAKGAQSLRKGKKKIVERYVGDVRESRLMDMALRWLGPGYRVLKNGRYVSKEGMRQFRYGKHETKTGKRHHAHFEAYDSSGGKVIEKSWVRVIP